MKLKTKFVQLAKFCFLTFFCFEWLYVCFYSVVTQVNDGPNYLVYITHDIFCICARQNILDSELVSKLKDMLDEYNVYAKSFMMAKDRYDNYQTENLNLQLLVNKKKDGRIYNLPIV